MCRRSSPVWTVRDVSDSRIWYEKRRPEILELFRSQEYGRLPDMKDVEIKIRVADSRQGMEIMECRALRRTVEVEAIRGETISVLTLSCSSRWTKPAGTGIHNNLQPGESGTAILPGISSARSIRLRQSYPEDMPARPSVPRRCTGLRRGI